VSDPYVYISIFQVDFQVEKQIRAYYVVTYKGEKFEPKQDQILPKGELIKFTQLRIGLKLDKKELENDFLNIELYEKRKIGSNSFLGSVQVAFKDLAIYHTTPKQYQPVQKELKDKKGRLTGTTKIHAITTGWGLILDYLKSEDAEEWKIAMRNLIELPQQPRADSTRVMSYVQAPIFVELANKIDNCLSPLYWRNGSKKKKIDGKKGKEKSKKEKKRKF